VKEIFKNIIATWCHIFFLSIHISEDHVLFPSPLFLGQYTTASGKKVTIEGDKISSSTG